MKYNGFKFRIFGAVLFIVLIVSSIGIASAIVYGDGKPKAVEIYIGDFPQVSSVGDDPSGDFKIIIDDEKYIEPNTTKYGKIRESEEGEPEPTVTTATPTPTPGDSGGGAILPVAGKVCQCESPKFDDGKKTTCVALFSYENTGDVEFEIPVRESSLPWNEFTGSGMVEQYRCQPTTFYVDESVNSPFWTNRFWNNIKWKLGHDQSALVKCEKSTPTCESLGYDSDVVCTDCKSNDG